MRVLVGRTATGWQVRELNESRPGSGKVRPAVADGRIRPVVDGVFNSDDALEAPAHLPSNQAAGKIVLRRGKG